MKPVLDSIRKRLRLFVLGLIVAMAVAMGVRLHEGPVRVDWIRTVLASRIEAALPNTHARISHVDFMWFSAPKALGFRMQDVEVRDHANRTIAQAGRVEMALAADSLILLHFMPARVTAQDFFVAASVSREGRYDLGYDAHGAPGASNISLEAFVNDLTGHEKLNRPLSFTRQIRLTNGRLRLVQEGANLSDSALDWSARVATIDFSKLHNQLKARIDLGVDSQGSHAHLLANADGSVGLSQARMTADIAHFNPAHVFPSIGPTQALSTVDADVNGTARVDYSTKAGFDGGAIDLTVGSGHAGFGPSAHAFDGARLMATYDAKTRTIAFSRLQLKAPLIDADLKGAVHISPEDARAHRDLSLDFDVYGPRVTGMLADDFAPQTLTDAHYRGSYIPAQRALHFASATGKLNGAPLSAQGAVYTDALGQLGVDLTAHIKGRFTKDEVFAFWPQDLSHPLRQDLIGRIKSGDFANADYVMKVKPGQFGHLNNDNLRLDFDFANATIGIEKRMADATQLRGHGRLEGASFQMDVSSGRLVNVELDRGGLSVPNFHDREQKVRIWVDAHADVPSVIEAVDPVTNNQLASHGLNRARLSGEAQGHVEITFPTYKRIEGNLNVAFSGHIHDAGFKQAALGWDLSQGEVAIAGDLRANRLELRGPGKLGPYTGDIDYATQMQPRTQAITINGSFNAAQFGGSPRVPVPIKGQFTVVGTKGSGTIDAAIFRGNVDWSGAEARPTQVNISGVTLSDGMEDQGLPIFDHLDRELPTRVTLLRSGEIWAGELDAEPLSGDIAYIEGERPRLVYTAQITPDEARQLGYGGLPMFAAPRHLTVDIALDSQSHEADIKLDQIDATLGWSEIPGTDQLKRRLKMELVPDDWATLGLPKSFFRPRAPMEVTAQWSQTETQLSGHALVAGQDISFEMPFIGRPSSSEAVGQIKTPGTPRSGPDGYYLKVEGTLDDAMLKALGYTQAPVRVAGPTALMLRLYNNVPGQPAGLLNIDATQTQLGVQATDWKKPAGETAQFAVSFDDQGQAHGVNLSHIVGLGDHVQIDGRASFSANGDLQFADFSNIYLKNFIDVSLKYYDLPDQNRRVFAVSGQQLDLRPWLQAQPADIAQAGNNAAPAANGGLVQPTPQSTHVVVDLGQVQTSGEGAFTNLKLDVAWDGRNGFDGQGNAHTLSGAPVSLLVRSEGGYSVFRVKTDDLGDVVRTATGVSNLVGGHAELAGAYMDGQVDADLTGKAIRVKQVPAMAQLLTVATLTGLNDTLAGDGIAFTDFNLPVRFRDRTLFIHNAWVKGKGLGMDVWGTTNVDAKTLDLTGTLIPAYSVNSLFGALPSKGLGLVGIKYELAGTYAAPRALVNPLSIIMPGFMKVWENRETRGRDPIAALNLPKAEQQLAQLRQAEKTQD